MKEIPTTNGRYLADKKGNIYSAIPQNKGKVKKLKPTYDKDGYLIVGLRIRKGKSKTLKVHRLIAATFIVSEFMFNPKLQVNHKNGIKHDNRLENLEPSNDKLNSLHRVYKLNKNSGLKPPLPVVHIASGTYYRSMNHAEQLTGFRNSGISAHINGLRKTPKWRLATEKEILANEPNL